ncbi:phage tail tube protein [Algoriphagus sp. D3-2-R+10]|uniref:phage tail tube protein n=1 Tax=Algoriphagus aurantiacus TaxID=3103948 RepID=UPI002B3C0A7C|nr:phage tail tube protein [Algoriphagus sp. D3-2-R+10]MEB2775232.1 phage tail tube protein [Algoriphagus sp. D3-2-R+10]
MSMSIGNFVALYKEVSGTYEAFGGEVSSSFSISKDNIEITTKDSVDDAGNFVKEFDGKGEYTFTFSVEGIQRADSSVDTKITDLMNGTKLKFRFGYNILTQKCYEGEGFINSMSIDSGKNEAVTFSAEIQGTGGLEIVTVSA